MSDQVHQAPTIDLTAKPICSIPGAVVIREDIAALMGFQLGAAAFQLDRLTENIAPIRPSHYRWSIEHLTAMAEAFGDLSMRAALDAGATSDRPESSRLTTLATIESWLEW